MRLSLKKNCWDFRRQKAQLPWNDTDTLLLVFPPPGPWLRHWSAAKHHGILKRAVLNSHTHWFLIAVWSGEVNRGLHCTWLAHNEASALWLAGGRANQQPEKQKQTNGGRRRQKKGRGGQEVTRASEGLTRSDRLAGTNTQTHRAFWAGCSAEHTQYSACFRTRGEREKRDERVQIREREWVFDRERERAIREKIMSHRCFLTNMLRLGGRRSSDCGLNDNSMTFRELPNCPPRPKNTDSSNFPLKVQLA